MVLDQLVSDYAKGYEQCLNDIIRDGEDLSGIVDACICSSSPTREYKCNDCLWAIKEPVADDIPCPPDLIENGTGYWVSCDCERITLTAAGVIKRLIDVKERYDSER